jgi:ABC-2 type transport system ATP-binding protein/lipopolysaccharide transport system ATP-binding protein
LVAIVLDNVSLDLPIYDVKRASLKKALLGRTIGGRFGESGSHITVRALKNITFNARDGDRIALIGDNGAGKSSLLRVVSKVYSPTAGIAIITGEISPLFDATLGMSMDATGLENIQLAGTIWGMTRSQIKNCFEDIAEFTELGDYLRVPVRTYSSGMMLRLAFAIATAREAEILLIDEIIGVGDAVFFEKAFARLHRLIQRSRIIMVASHQDRLLRRLCNKAIWLSHGNLVEYSDIERVISAHNQESSRREVAHA